MLNDKLLLLYIGPDGNPEHLPCPKFGSDTPINLMVGEWMERSSGFLWSTEGFKEYGDLERVCLLVWMCLEITGFGIPRCCLN